MSIALDNTNSCSGSRRRMEGSEFMHGNGMSCVSSFDSPPPPDLLPGDRNQEQRHEASTDSSPSSSIGKNSDISGRLSSDGEDPGDTTAEVQSSFKGGPLDDMDALEEVLPIRRGISRFYNGKSKSFASLAFGSSSSIQDVAKSENAYTRRRRNLIASSLAWDKNRGSRLRSNGASAGGISKRLTNLSRTKLALAVAMTTSDSNSSDGDLNSNTNLNLISRSSSSSLRRPQPFLADQRKSLSPHLPRHLSAWRSFSLADLQFASAENTQTSGGHEHPQTHHEKLT